MASRIGGLAPREWKTATRPIERQAKEIGFEGVLGAKLDELEEELADQDGTHQRLKNVIDTFDSVAPTFFAGDMTKDLERVRAYLASFKTDEIDVERKFADDKREEMTERVDTRLYQEESKLGERYRTRRNRRDRLKALPTKLVLPAIERAAEIDSALKRAEDARESADEAWDDYTGEEGSLLDAGLAAGYASEARGHIETFHTQYGSFGADMRLLRNHLTTIKEGLVDAVPADPVKQRWFGFGKRSGPPIQLPDFKRDGSWEDADKLGSARQKFSPIAESLDNLAAELERRRVEQQTWIDDAISRRISEEVSAFLTEPDPTGVQPEVIGHASDFDF